MSVRGVWLSAAVILLAPGLLLGQTNRGRANRVPWSGSWYSARSGSILKPLGKYDQITGKNATGWEMAHGPIAGPMIQNWEGYCHAFTAASIMEPEPRRPIKYKGVSLSVGNQKGMLVLAYNQDYNINYGRRFDGDPGNNMMNIAPGVLWKALKKHVQNNGEALAVNIDPGPQVWTYPVYNYRVNYKPQGNSGTYYARMELKMANMEVGPNYVGTKVKKKVYYFTFQMKDGEIQYNSAQWTDESITNHPDYAWFPTKPKPKNPEINFDTVKRILDQ